MQQKYLWFYETYVEIFFQTVLIHNVLEIEEEYGKTSWIAANVKRGLSNELKQPEVNNSVSVSLIQKLLKAAGGYNGIGFHE